MYRSDDDGQSWHRVLGGAIRRLTLSPTFAFDHTLLALGVGAAPTWASQDRGQTWVEFSAGGRFWFSPLYWYDRVLFAAAGRQLLQRRGDPDGWSSVLTDTRVRGLVFSPRYRADGTLLAYGDGLYRSASSGAQWGPTGLDLDDDDRV